MDRATHWRGVYHDKPADTLSWYQPLPAVSLEFIKTLAPDRRETHRTPGGARQNFSWFVLRRR